MYELLLKNPSNVLKALILQIEWCNIFSEKKKKYMAQEICYSKKQGKFLSLSQSSVVCLFQFYSKHVKKLILIQSIFTFIKKNFPTRFCNRFL